MFSSLLDEEVEAITEAGLYESREAFLSHAVETLCCSVKRMGMAHYLSAERQTNQGPPHSEEPSGRPRSSRPRTSRSTSTAPTRAPQKTFRPVAAASGSGA